MLSMVLPDRLHLALELPSLTISCLSSERESTQMRRLLLLFFELRHASEQRGVDCLRQDYCVPFVLLFVRGADELYHLFQVQ